MPYSFVADSFHTQKKNFVVVFLQANAILDGNWQFCCFEPFLGALEATYDDHFRLIGKRVGDFLLVLIECFR